MAVKVICPSCGYENQTVGMFCVKCGGKMVNPEMKQDKTPLSARLRSVWGIVRTTVLLLLLVSIGMLMWPQPTPVGWPDPNAEKTYRQKVGKLKTAIENKALAAEFFTQQEINSYLAIRLASTEGASESSGLRVGLTYIGFELQQGRVNGLLVSQWGPIKLTFAVQGVAMVTDRGVRLVPDKAGIGHLPLPSSAAGLVADKFQQTLGGLEQDVFVLQHARQVDVLPGKIHVKVGPR